MKRLFAVALLAAFTLMMFNALPAKAHCEIPCGIYDDEARLKEIDEHITTIEKSMKMINELSMEKEKNYNQIVRWINNKDDHANKLQHIVTQYFMTQRVKPVDDEKSTKYYYYEMQIKTLHKMLIYAMKAKQTTDLNNVTKLKMLNRDFRKYYIIKPIQMHKEEKHEH